MHTFPCQTHTHQVLRQIRTKGFVRSVSLDPEGSYVAASLADGNLGIWDVNDGSQEMRKHVCPKVWGPGRQESAAVCAGPHACFARCSRRATPVLRSGSSALRRACRCLTMRGAFPAWGPERRAPPHSRGRR
jgi:hypothetical protein